MLVSLDGLNPALILAAYAQRDARGMEAVLRRVVVDAAQPDALWRARGKISWRRPPFETRQVSWRQFDFKLQFSHVPHGSLWSPVARLRCHLLVINLASRCSPGRPAGADRDAHCRAGARA